MAQEQDPASRELSFLESMGKDRFSIGAIAPTAELVDQYFNDSTGVDDRGERDATGPWNEGGDWIFVDNPAFQPEKSEKAGTRQSNGGQRHSR